MSHPLWWKSRRRWKEAVMASSRSGSIWLFCCSLWNTETYLIHTSNPSHTDCSQLSSMWCSPFLCARYFQLASALSVEKLMLCANRLPKQIPPLIRSSPVDGQLNRVPRSSSQGAKTQDDSKGDVKDYLLTVKIMGQQLRVFAFSWSVCVSLWIDSHWEWTLANAWLTCGSFFSPPSRTLRRSVPPADHRVPHRQTADSGTGKGRLGDPSRVPAPWGQTGPGLLRRSVDRWDTECFCTKQVEVGEPQPEIKTAAATLQLVLLFQSRCFFWYKRQVQGQKMTCLCRSEKLLKEKASINCKQQLQLRRLVKQNKTKK